MQSIPSHPRLASPRSRPQLSQSPPPSWRWGMVQTTSTFLPLPSPPPSRPPSPPLSPPPSPQPSPPPPPPPPVPPSPPRVLSRLSLPLSLSPRPPPSLVPPSPPTPPPGPWGNFVPSPPPPRQWNTNPTSPSLPTTPSLWQRLLPARWQRQKRQGRTSSTLSSLFVPDFLSARPRTCPNCKSRPVAYNLAAGKYFNHCSKSCAIQARNPGLNNRGGQANTLCELCQLRPKFRMGNRVYPYCGQTCANVAGYNGPTQSNHANFPLDPPIPDSIQRATYSGPICRTAGCSLPIFTRQDGTTSKHCSVTHEEWTERGCIFCRAAPMSSVSVLCEDCHDGAQTIAPMLIKVPKDHENFKNVQSQFKQTWRHNTTCPNVKAVYKIIITEASLEQYQRYLDDVEARGDFVAQGKSRGNELRRWHGTRRKCRLGDRGRTTPCTDPGCSLCCIIRSSFDLKFYKSATGWGRFGHGIYTSSTSSKANDYSKNIGRKSKRKALLLNKVAVGNGKRLTQNNTSLTGPPPGFDSIMGEAAPGGALNYDELVVYTNDAVRPSYLVMYKSP